MPYSEIISQILLEHNLSQEELGANLGVNQTTVSMWVLGKKKPSYDSIYMIYKKFDITPNELFGLDK